MSNLISREEAINAIISESLKDGAYGYLDAYSIADLLKNLPTKEPERKRGKWILSDIQNPEDVRNGNYVYICSNCLHSDTHAKTTVVPFCWHCGADMRGEE